MVNPAGACAQGFAGALGGVGGSTHSLVPPSPGSPSSVGDMMSEPKGPGPSPYCTGCRAFRVTRLAALLPFSARARLPHRIGAPHAPRSSMLRPTPTMRPGVLQSHTDWEWAVQLVVVPQCSMQASPWSSPASSGHSSSRIHPRNSPSLLECLALGCDHVPSHLGSSLHRRAASPHGRLPAAPLHGLPLLFPRPCSSVAILSQGAA